MAGTHQLWGYDVNYDRTGSSPDRSGGPRRRPAVQAELAQPSGLAPLGRLLGFVDAESSSLRVLAPAERGGVEVATVIGAGLFEWGDQDGSIGEARLCSTPRAIASITQGFIVSDTYNHRLRSVHMEAGTVTTIAGGEPGFRDGTGREARFFEPGGLARIGDVLIVADTGNHALRRVDLSTGVVTSLLPMGLEPPATPARRLEPATLAANAEVTLLVTLEAPPGTHLDSSGGPPVHVRLSSDPPEAIEPPAPQTTTVLPAAVTVRTLTGSGTLRIEARGAFCDIQDGEGAACRLVESAYVLPFTLEPGDSPG